MATIRILKRYDDDTCGHTDENAGRFHQRGARDTSGQMVDLFGVNPFCLDYSHLTLRAIVAGESGRATKCTVFGRLVEAWQAGHCDEAIHMAGRMAIQTALPTPLRDAMMAKNATFIASNDAEFEILRVACIVAIFTLEGHPDVNKLPTADEQQMLAVLKTGLPIKIFSAAYLEKIPKFAKSFVFDTMQLVSHPPPIGIIPNNLSLCYAASVLTLILSLPTVVNELLNVSGRVCDTLHLMLMYAWHLRTGAYSHHELASMNEELVKCPEFNAFGHGLPDDSVDFAIAMLTAFRKWAPGAAALFGDVYMIPNLVGSDMIKSSAMPPDRIDLPFDVHETLAGNTWTGTFIYEPVTHILSETVRPPLEFRYKDRAGRWLGSLKEIVAAAIGSARPKILLICHNIQVNENPEAFSIPCTLDLSSPEVGSVMYSIHGAVLHDNQYSEGHYISTIAANTSMYFYDPQYTAESEDPRVYRPRLLCYVMV